MNEKLQQFIDRFNRFNQIVQPYDIAVKIDIFYPYHCTGVTVICLSVDDYTLFVQFDKDQIFGLYSGCELWNNTVDEVTTDVTKAIDRAFQLLSSKQKTTANTTL